MTGEGKILPQDWMLAKMEDVCDIISGKNQSKVINPEGKYPIYGSSGIFGYADDYLCNEGTTVVGRKGTINSPLFVKTKFWNVDTAFGLSPKDNYDKKLLYYFCLGFNFHKLDKSTTIPSLAKRDLLNIDIPLPPKPTQKAIVSKIEELFSELDKGIEQLKTAQQQLKTYRQSVLKWAFEGKLTNENVKDGELPEGWKWSTVGDVSNGVEYGSAAKSKEQGEIPVLRMGNIQNGRFDWDDLVYTDDDDEINKYLLKKNDVLFNRTNSAELVGKTAIYKGERPAIFAGYLIRINLIEELINADYLNYYLNTKKAKEYGNSVRSFGVNQSNINGTKLKTYPLPQAPLIEQERVVKEIESRFSVADKMEESIIKSLQQAEALRQSILKKAFEGKLVPEVKAVSYKPKNDYFFECQILAYILRASKKRNIRHGEMTLAKYAYLAVKIFGIPLTYVFKQWHLGPYPPEIKKAVNNKQFFLHTKKGLELTNDTKVLKYNNPYREKTEEATEELISIFGKYDDNVRPHKTELLATVCKAIEDTESTDFVTIREAMKNWKIELKNSKNKNKAEKFTEEETRQCIGFIIAKGWDRKLI